MISSFQSGMVYAKYALYPIRIKPGADNIHVERNIRLSEYQLDSQIVILHSINFLITFPCIFAIFAVKF